MDKKECTACGNLLDESEFYRRKNGKLSSMCKKCCNKKSHEYYIEHKERARELGRIWVKGHPDQVKASKRKYAENSVNREKKKAQYRTVRLEYIARAKRSVSKRILERRAYEKEYRKNNNDIIRAWWHNNPDRVSEYARKRREAERNAGTKFTNDEFEGLKNEYDHKCLRCGRIEPEIILEPDHVVPLSKGGENGIGNIQPLCGSCNSWKKDKIIDFREKPNDTL